VTFNVSGGPYTERLNLNAVNGTSATNRVTFNGNGRTIRFGASVTGERAVIALNGTDYITIDSLNVDATNGGAPGTYGWGISLTSQADNNTIRRCVVTTSESSTSTNFAGIVASGSATSATTTGNSANNLLLEDNTVIGGYYGITLTGTSSTTRGTGNVLRNNTVRDFYFYGLYCSYQQGAQYVGNDIHRTTRSAVSSFYGMYVYYNLSSVVQGNRIHNPFTGASGSTSAMYGIYYYYSDGTAAAPALVANNLVYNIDGAGTSYGIYHYYSDYVDYFHNTVTLDDAGTGTTLRAYYQYMAVNATLRNNIFSVTQPASTSAHALYVYQTGTAAPTLVSNNNDLYVGSGSNAYVGYYGTSSTATTGSAATLTAWQAVSSNAFDQNSQSANPYFVNPATGNLTPTAAALDGAGSAATLTRVPRDFNGVLRTSPPDIGAVEFTPAANDVALRRVVSPVSPIAAGTFPVTVSIRNNGGSALTSVTLAYTLNGGTAVTQAFTGLNVASGDTAQLTFTTRAAFASGCTTLSVVGSLPNGGPDANAGNNTVSSTLCTALTGTFTINNLQPTGGTNFASFTAATAALSQGGVAGPVTFNVSNGPYNEQISLSPLTGSSATNRVTFNGNGRTIQFAANTTGQRAVIALNGADYITIDSLNIDATNAGSPGTYGWGVLLTNQADNNTISHCVVTSSTSSTSSNFAGIVASGSATGATTSGNSANNLLLEGNTVIGGYYGVTLVGTSTTVQATGNVLRNNTVRDFYYYGVYGYYQNGAQYIGNDINRATRTSTTTFYGMYLYYNDGIRVEGNRIHSPFTASGGGTSLVYGIYVYYSDGTAATPNLIANNAVYNIDGGGTTYGIYNYYSNYGNYYHNTVSLDDAAAGGTSVRAYSQYMGTFATLRNNIFSVTRPASTAAYAVYVYGTTANLATSPLSSNYNDLYVGSGSNAFVGYVGTSSTATTGGASTLTAWQALNSNAYDQNSVSLDPRFRSATDVRPTNVGLNNTGTATTITAVPRDITGTLRTSPPDMGAYEFTPTANDVQVVSIDGPATTAVPGTNPVVVTIRNGGTVTLTSVTLSYALNGGTPVTQAFNGLTLAAGASQQFTFGQGVVVPSGSNTLTVMAALPNGQADGNPSDNTLTTNFTQPTPDNDEPCTAVALGSGPTTGSNSGASTTVQPTIITPACSPANLPKDVWFTMTPSGTSTTLTLTGAASGMVRVFTAANCATGPFTQVFCAGSGANNTTVGTVAVTGLTAGQRYYVAVSGYGSSDTGGQFTIAATGLVLGTKTQTNSTALTVFPNPSNTGQLTLQVARPLGTGTVELLNALGQVVQRQPLATGEQTVRTTGLAAGLYTLRVQAGAEVLTRKVVLQ
jgi:nitrous oxidase accessory protein NosD